MTIDQFGKALAVLAAVLAASAPLAVSGEVFTSPPPLMPRWDYLVDSGVLLSLAWSPDGEALAVVNNLFSGPTSSRILVLSRNGTLLWDSGDVGKGLGDIAWGPNGEIAAVPILGEGLIVAIPGNGTVRDLPINGVRRVAWNMVKDVLLVQVAQTSARVITPTGNVTLMIGVGKPIHDLGWSPDGRYAYFAADDGVTIINPENATRDAYMLRIPGAVKVMWSHDSRFVAVASQKTNNYFGNITVVDLETGEKWSVSGAFYDFSFRPGTHEVLIGGNNLTLYSEGGEVLWETEVMPPTIIVSWAYEALWHPSGDNVTLLKQESELIIVDGDTGEVVWRSELGFRGTYPAQDPRGEYIAMIAGSRRVITYGKASGLATIKVLTSACPTDCAVIFSGGGSVKSFSGGPGEDIDLYATPGNYTITFRLQVFPSDWGTVIGNSIGWLLNNTVSKELEVEAGGDYEISPPLEELRQAVLSGLGRVTIRGPPNILVLAFWGPSGASSRVSIPESGEITVYAVPDTYRFEVVLPSGERTAYGEVVVEPGATVTVDLTALFPAETTTSTTTTTQQAGEAEETATTTTQVTEVATTTTPSATETTWAYETTTAAGAPQTQPGEETVTGTEPAEEGGGISAALIAVIAVVAVLAVAVLAKVVRGR